MPDIGLYLDTEDLPLLQKFLDEEEEIAFVIRSASGYFELADSVALEPKATYALWHIPNGDVPSDCRDNQGNIVVNPGTSVHLGAILLDLEVSPGKYQQLVPRSQGGYELQTLEDPTAIGRSGFTWWGNHFGPIGKKAHPATHKWWERLRRWVKKHGERVPSTPFVESGPDLRMWAFPFACEAFKQGRPRSCNPVLWHKRRDLYSSNSSEKFVFPGQRRS